MGNTESTSYQKRLSRILPEEQSEFEQAFENLCRAKDTSKNSVGLQAFKEYLGNSLPESMTMRIFSSIQSVTVNGKGSAPPAEINKEQFGLFLADLLRGTAEEKSCIIFQMLNSESEQVKGSQLQQFSEDLIASVVHVVKNRNLLNGWALENMQASDSGARTLASQLLSQLKPTDGQSLEEPEFIDSSWSRASIEDWLYKVPIISTFVRVVVILGLSIIKHQTELQKDISHLVPKCKRMAKKTSFVTLLDLPSVMYLNSHLPFEMQHMWRLLFSSQVHGESFSQLCGHIEAQGQCVLVLKDSDGFIFGGFASQTWEVKPQFQGDSRCFLFSISPRLDVHTYTGYNDHYMYLNYGQQTMPNGLGMGGQHDYFGLWIDSDFGRGHSKAKPRCTTYNSPQLSAKEDFTIDAIEVWAVGDLPEHLLSTNKKSVLDADPEATALLEMMGRTRQSEGLRDKDEDD
ncbi:hypothetical protein FKM82_003658 [Ascaphus truei]